MFLAMPVLGILPGKEKDRTERVVIEGTKNYDGEYMVRPDPYPSNDRWARYDGTIQIDLETGGNNHEPAI